MIESWITQGEYINHITGEVHFLNLFMKKNKVVLTIHDCGMVYRKKGLLRYLVKKIYLDWPLKKATVITVVSETTKQELLKFTGNKKADIRVIPNFIDYIFQPSSKLFSKQKPVILNVGTSYNKNLLRLIEAIQGIDCKLLIIGKLNHDQLYKLAQCEIDYTNCHNLTTAEMLKCYIESDILAFVSTYEGFGMPIIEANCVERVVVTSDISSMPEVAGDAACFVNPFSVDSIKAGILKVINDDEYRNGLIEKGRRNWKKYDPNRISAQYYSIYQEVYKC